MLLRRIYSRFRRHQPGLGVGLHLDEAEDTMIPCDQIDLSPVLWRAKILSDDAITSFAEIEVGFHFAATGDPKMFGFLLAKAAGDCVQGTHDESGEPEHSIQTGNKPPHSTLLMAALSVR